MDIADSLVLRPPPGSAVLVDSTAGPIAAIAPRDSYENVVLGFEIVGRAADGSRTANTNWPRRLRKRQEDGLPFVCAVTGK